MELRCKIFRAAEAGTLEAEINRFLDEQTGEVQFEEITQSEGPGGVTVVVWYSLGDVDSILEDLEEGPDEVHDVRPDSRACPAEGLPEA
jgi:hypothetical protein